jgi:hypothetical protein
MAQIINPLNIYWYTKSDRDWEIARNAASSDTYTEGDGINEKVSLTTDSGYYFFYRTYLEFDLKDVISVNNARLYISASTNVSNTTIHAAYGGNSLSGTTADYNLYLTNIVTETPLSTIQIKSKGILYSGLLDITTYPIDPKDGRYVIGLVTEQDFTNTIDGTATGIEGVFAYLSINEASGYPNTVMGISGANISTVSGVPSANISKIMGA